MNVLTAPLSVLTILTVSILKVAMTVYAMMDSS